MRADPRLVFALLYVGVQALLPLRYYLGEDRYDERFAWRMFSPIRMLRCEAQVQVDGQPLELGAQFHSAWLALVERGRQDVTDAVVRRVCLTHPGQAVTLRYACRESDGAVTELARGDVDLCAAEAP